MEKLPEHLAFLIMGLPNATATFQTKLPKWLRIDHSAIDVKSRTFQFEVDARQHLDYGEPEFKGRQGRFGQKIERVPHSRQRFCLVDLRSLEDLNIAIGLVEAEVRYNLLQAGAFDDDD